MQTNLRATAYLTADHVPGLERDYGISTQLGSSIAPPLAKQFFMVSKLTTRQHHLLPIHDQIENVTIYFVHQRSHSLVAVPIFRMHGSSGIFYKFSDITPLLVSPTKNEYQAFHVLGPSLPGFCFSIAPLHRGWSIRRSACVVDDLVLCLGFGKSCGRAGDMGQFVSRKPGVSSKYASHCRRIHLNYCPDALLENLKDSELAPREKSCGENGLKWRIQLIGDAVRKRTRPQTLNWMLQRSVQP